MTFINSTFLGWALPFLCCFITSVSQGTRSFQCKLCSSQPLAIYFQSVQGVSASESGVRNLPLIISMSITSPYSKPSFLIAYNSSFCHHLRRPSHHIRPLRTILDTRSHSNVCRGWPTLYFRCGIYSLSLDWLPDFCRYRTWDQLPNADYGWTSTCERRRRCDSDGYTYV
jgi:hypothetical protein